MDANLFCEIIESIPSVLFIRQEEKGGYIFRIYQGPREMVIIDYDDSLFEDEVGKVYLTQLGLADMIPSLFPKEPTIPTKPFIASTNLKDTDCAECNGIGQLESMRDNNPVICNACNGTGENKYTRQEVKI